MKAIGIFFQRLSDYIQIFFDSLSWAIIILILLAVILMISITFLIINSIKNNHNTTKQLTDNASKYKKSNIIKNFFYKKSINYNAIHRSFNNANELLIKAIGVQNYKYKLPWYLLLGISESGKTTIAMQLESAFSPKINKESPASWIFFKHGVLVDVRGDLFLEKDSLNANENLWRSLLITLEKERSKRPINGIIITIPVSELYCKNASIDMEQISERANFISQKIINAQNILGIRMPVYIIFTKCDFIPGFKSFCSEISFSNSTNIIGWSNYYSDKIEFNENWITDGFDQILEDIYRVQLEILSKPVSNDVRDGVFVFPIEFAQIKYNLKTYLSKIFRNDTYEESSILRGFYFVGDSGLEILSSVGSNSSDGLVKIINNNENSEVQLPERINQNRKLFFIEDLFKIKIFSESGIVKPLTKHLSKTQKKIRNIKISIVAFFLIGSYGVYRAHSKLNFIKDDLAPILYKLNLDVRKLRKIDYQSIPEKAEECQIYSGDLLFVLNQMDNMDFFSFFIPASWISPLRADLYKIIEKTYHITITRAIYLNLLCKIRDLFNKRPYPNKKTKLITNLIEIEKSNEFLYIKKYLNDLDTLSRQIDNFNSLKVTRDLNALNSLIEYSFNTKLPNGFWSKQDYIDEFLKNVPFSSIELLTYSKMAQKILFTMFEGLSYALFSEDNLFSIPGRLNQFIKYASKKSNIKHLSDIRKFNIELSDAKKIESGYSWMDYSVFNPQEEVIDTFYKIEKMHIFGKDIKNKIIKKISNDFYEFQHVMRNINQLIYKNQKSSSDSMFTSQGLSDLQRSLKLLFKEPYMSIQLPYKYDNTVPDGYIVCFDEYLIQSAHDMIQQYEEFASKHLEDFPRVVRENIHLDMQESLKTHIDNLIYRAKSIVKIKSGNDLQISEEIVRTQIDNLKKISPSIIKILNALNQGINASQFIAFRDTIVKTCTDLLDRVDKMLKNLAPFYVKTFAWWDGSTSMALTSFGAKDIDDLKQYMDLQISLITELALDFAKPIIELLSSHLMLEFDTNKILFNKWKRIVSQVVKYKGSVPGNSLRDIEYFILKEMNKINTDIAIQKIKISDNKKESGDYFAESLRRIKMGIRARAEVIKRKQSIENYKKIIEFFNQFIKDRFPFIDRSAKFGVPELEPDVLKDFFVLYDSFGGSAKNVLSQLFELPNAKNIYNFLKQIDNVREFFGNFLDKNSSYEIPSFNVDIKFRTNRDFEKGGEFIMDWAVVLDGSYSINNYDSQTKFKWLYGSNIDFKFVWPNSSQNKPIKDIKQPELQIDDNTALFQYNSKWALLWLVRAHNANREVEENIDPFAYTLKFEVPISDGKKSILYNQIRISTNKKNKRSVNKLVKVPDFPTFAPAISDDIIAIADQPILTEGDSNNDFYTIN